ncbi:DUF1631 domain-containing protein [Marinobacter manganoxydans]|mgnify:FL=1|jgi:hypothetical protein|uniref:Thymidine phosphorylase n=3 Tax=Marinobacter TaxID=2742 RepID=G6YT17_9GAMM|nr:DUF1631 domain-containing protein [Marinobacter manganoxydans]MBQ93936.1 DUF1631 domain-containing protein [Marinobacter sp.]MCP4062947.1 DUF1631 domain-containing protein [Gammaproteobacteria bacterium]HAU19614.1 DUF1631 domain-containing protein [Marinobacter adhaerens]EHJ04619.1 hypothetical protein KYE_10038 [Marinobacter manganoxydans MnI7-9]MTI76353.1 DUF1631 domain-containing protein [Marinobacter sp.]|tara:strand:- start:8080 stop:10377 length:2298 start_codon:yes stop_codon:yes gene_type:complete
MVHDNKVVSFSGRKPPARFSLPASLVRLRDASGQSLKSVLASFFDRADDALFELADRAGSNLDQTAYFDAMRELRLRRKAMVVSILQYVSQAFNEIGRFQPQQSARSLDEVDEDSLSLVDHSQLEQQVAVDNLINKLRNRYTEQIRLLTVRVGHLVPGIELKDAQMPLSPEIICGGVAEACADLDIDIRAKLVVLKLFDRLLADTLGDFYKEANRTLISEGVMPDMKRPPTGKVPSRSGQRGSGESSVPTSASGQADSASESQGMSQSQATFSELSALLHRGESNAVTGGSSVGESYIDTDRLMARLTEAQSSSRQWGEGTVVPLNEQLQPILRSGDGNSLSVGQVDSDVINLVSMLFDFILEDRQLHPVMKALIGRLQIPVLKVALSDKNFFNRGGHPVRKLLNELALSAIGWTEKKAGQRDPLRDKIESVVDRVLTEFTTNVSLFEELLKDFSHFMDLDRRRRELVEQRLRDAEEGRARQERASQAAEGLVKELTEQRDVPEPVAGLLSEAWTRYLQWVVLREGEESDRWQHARNLTEQLVWSVDPRPVTDTTRSDLLRAIPAIVDDLRKALQDISWDPFATDAAIRDLELAHVDVFQRLVTAPSRPESPSEPEDLLVPEPAAEQPVEPPEPAAEDAVKATPSPAEPEVPVSVVSEAASQADAETQTASVSPEWLSKAESLRVGSWIELTRDETRVRCKLAAFIKATGKYIFVNRSGAKVAEYLRQELAADMEFGKISMLDDGLIFDRALESIIDNLRSSRKD